MIRKILLSAIIVGVLAVAPIKSSQSNPIVGGLVGMGLAVYAGYLIAGTYVSWKAAKKIEQYMDEQQGVHDAI